MKLFIIILICILFLSCSKEDNPFSTKYNPCRERMDQARRELGEPEDIYKLDSSGYKSESWWWWTKGLSYTWSWGSNVKGCQKTTYKFDPIGKEATE